MQLVPRGFKKFLKSILGNFNRNRGFTDNVVDVEVTAQQDIS